MTLTDAAMTTKRGVRISIVFGVVFLILWIIYRIVYATIIQPIQVANIKPNLAYGLLDKPVFPITLIPSDTLTYTLNTDTGFLPNINARMAKVYSNPPPAVSLLSPDNAKTLAAKFGFTDGPTIISPTLYQFSDDNGGQMDIDISSENFSYTRPSATPESSQTQNFSDDTALEQDLINYLSTESLKSKELSTKPAAITFDGPTRDQSQTAKISLWQADIDGLPIVTSTFNQGLVTGTLSKYLFNEDRYVSLDYTYWPIDTTQFATYPLKTVQQAYDELKNGGGTVIVDDKLNKDVSVTSVFIGYYLPKTYIPYIQPVFVFKGDTFVAYVPALAANSFKTSASSSNTATSSATHQ